MPSQELLTQLKTNSITRIDCLYTIILADKFQSFIDVLASNTSVTTLLFECRKEGIFDFTEAGDKNFEKLMKVLEEHPTIQSFGFQLNDLINGKKRNRFSRLLQAIAKSNCTSLSMDGYSLRREFSTDDIPEMARLLKANTTLTELKLQGWWFGYRESKSYGIYKVSLPASDRYNISLLASIPNLTSLDLIVNELDWEAISLFMNELAQNRTSLQHLDLRNNCSLAENLYSILNNLKKNRTLTSLCVGGPYPKGDELCLALADFFIANKTLKSFSLIGGNLGTHLDTLFNTINNNSTLTDLCLRECYYQNNFGFLSHFLMTNTSVQRLFIHTTNYYVPNDEQSRILIALKSNRTLKHLSLPFCRPSSGKLWSDLLDHNHTLQSIYSPLSFEFKEYYYVQDCLERNKQRFPYKWGRIAILIAFIRANQDSKLQLSIINLVPSIMYYLTPLKSYTYSHTLFGNIEKTSAAAVTAETTVTAATTVTATSSTVTAVTGGAASLALSSWTNSRTSESGNLASSGSSSSSSARASQSNATLYGSAAVRSKSNSGNNNDTSTRCQCLVM